MAGVGARRQIGSAHGSPVGAVKIDLHPLGPLESAFVQFESDRATMHMASLCLFEGGGLATPTATSAWETCGG